MKKITLLICLSILTVGVTAQNLVLNPGFENWDDATTPTDWTTVESVSQEDVELHSGSYSAKHTGGTSDLGQTIAVTGGQNYQLSFWYKVESGDGEDARIWCVWEENGNRLYDDTGGEIRGPDGGYLSSGSGEWLQYSTTTTAPANATDLYLEVRTYSGSVTYYDDFVLEEYIDTDAPVFESGYPMAGNIEDVQFDLMAQLDETSTVYYVVLDDGATAPTVAEVQDGTGSGGATAVTAGSFTAGTSETAETVSGLVVETSYDVYVVAEDDEDTPNVQADVSLVEVTTVVVPDVLFMADFESALDPFTQFSEAGDSETWYHNGGGYAEINGYQSGETQTDWLISPEYDLAGVTTPTLEFDARFTYGTNDDTHYLKLYYSEDYDGNTDNLATATWTELTFDLPAYDTWETVGPLDLSAITGTAYFAFAYNYPDDYSRWSIDNFKVLGFAAQGTDATLSDLQVDGTTVEGFEAAKLDYTYELPAGTTTVPTVTATPNDAGASAAVTDASDLTGDEAARTTTIEVTAEDGTTTQTYSITFNPVIEVADLAALRAATDFDRTYKVTGEVVLTFQQDYRNKKYVQDGTGGIEIDDDPGVITSTYAIADGITGLEGTLEDYNGLLQFHPTADPGAATSNGNDITPTVVTPADINADIDAYESMLVKVESVTFADADGSATFADGDNYDINGVSESMVCRVHFYGTSLTGTVIPDSAHVTGIVLEYNGTAQISPRSADDVEELIEVVLSDDATLSDIMVDGTSIPDFSPALMTYNYTLPPGTTDVPAVTAETTDENASVAITDATDLAGDEAERTTTIEVTAEDGETTKTYSVIFDVEVGIGSDLFSGIRIYPVPANEQLHLEEVGSVSSIRVYDITGTMIMNTENDGQSSMTLDISHLSAGVYMLRMDSDTESGVVRFVKK